MQEATLDHSEIREAGNALLSVCDGAASKDDQGFNGFDSPFARDVLGKSPWTIGQARAMYKVLRKYRKQLQNDHGIIYDEIPNPEETVRKVPVQANLRDAQNGLLSPASPHEKPVVTHSVHDRFGLQFRCDFPFDPEVKDAFRASIDITIWDGVLKVWIVPGKCARQLLDFAKRVGWVWSDDALFEAMSRDRSLREEVKKRQEAIKASTADDSDFMIDFESKSGHKLFPYQRAGAEYLATRERAFLADEMGLGKTVQALAAIHAVKGTPALIICPAAVTTTWKRHVEEWLPGVAVTVAPQKPVGTARSIHVTSYDRCTRAYDDLMKLPWKTVVCDEAHALKNREAKRTQRICGHQDRRSGTSIPGLLEKAQYRFMLTGTPVPNRPVELIQPLMGLDRLRDVGGFVGYATRYCGWQKGIPGSIQGNVPENLPELNEKLRASCWVRRKKGDVMKDLPPKFTDHVPMRLSNENEYRRALKNVRDFLDNDPGIAEAMVQFTVLQGLCAKGKVEAALDWVENFIDSGEKLVLFGWHKAPVKAIYEKFKDRAVILTGDSSQKQRDQAVDSFQESEGVRLFCCTWAAGEGITLTAASHMAFIELPWNPGKLDQASDRIHRIGQEAEEVTYHFLLAENTIDEDIAALIDAKRKTIKAIEDGEAIEDEDLIRDLIGRIKEGANST